MTVLDRVTEVQDQVLTAIANTKEPVTTAVATVVGYVVDRAPQVPALPFADQLPTPKELIDNQAKFASKLVTTNKSVALSVAKAAQPLTDQLLDRTPAASRVKAA
jgi:hypothetical protein